MMQSGQGRDTHTDSRARTETAATYSYVITALRDRAVPSLQHTAHGSTRAALGVRWGRLARDCARAAAAAAARPIDPRRAQPLAAPPPYVTDLSSHSFSSIVSHLLLPILDISFMFLQNKYSFSSLYLFTFQNY